MRSQNGTTQQKVRLRYFLIPIVVGLSGFTTTALSVDPLGTILPNGAGHLLETDREGHFLQDIEYVDYITFKYRKDGSFEKLSYSGRDAKGRKILFSGDIGTYQYDPRKLTIIRRIQLSYGSRGWERRPPEFAGIQFSQEYFAENAHGDVFEKIGNEWVSVTTEMTDLHDNPQKNTAFTTKSTFEIAQGKQAYKRGSILREEPTTGAFHILSIWQETADAEILPEGATFEKGQSIRLQLTNLHGFSQGYDWTIGRLGDAKEHTREREEMHFTNMGMFMIFTPEQRQER